VAQVKAHEVDAYLAKPDPRHLIYLIYGPDAGLVAERGKALAEKSGVNLDDPFSFIKMDGDALEAPSAVVEEAHTISMFGGKRLIRFRPNAMRNPVDAIKAFETTPPEDAIIVVEAGDLNKTNPMRKFVEKLGHGIALPCYQDEARALAMVVDQELQAANLTMDRNTRDVLMNMLGSDRMVSRNEVRKLCLYCMGQDRISLEDVEAVVGDVGANAVDEIVDAAATGNMKTMDLGFRRLAEAGTDPFVLLSSALRHFQMLHHLRAEHEAGGGPVKSLMARARPPIYFKRSQAVMRVLSSWNAQDLMAACNRLGEAIASSRTNTPLQLEIARSCMTAITVQSQRRR
jgi:DNA polymerase-3 subunit delta